MLHVINAGTYVAAMLIFLIGAWRSPPSCVAALYCMFPLKQLGQSSIGPLQSHSSLTNIFVGLIVLLALFRNWPTLTRRLRHDLTSYFLAVSLYVYAMCSIIWTLAPEEALQNWRAAWPYVVTSILLAPLAICNIGEMRTALRWLMWIGGLVCLVLLIGGDWGARGLVVSGTDGEFESNPLAIAVTAGAVVIAALIQRPGSYALLEIPAAMVAGISAIFLIIRSGSRGELLAVIVAIAIVIPLRFRITKLRDILASAIVVMSIGIGLMVGMSQYMAGGEARWSKSTITSDTTGRFDMALKLLEKWSKSGNAIVFGLGNSASFDPRVIGFYPHVMPAEILGEEGLIGLLLFLGLIFMASRSGLIAWESAADQVLAKDTIASAIALAVFAFIVSSKQGDLLSNYLLFTGLVNVCRISREAPGIFVITPSTPMRPQNLMS